MQNLTKFSIIPSWTTLIILLSLCWKGSVPATKNYQDNMTEKKDKRVKRFQTDFQKTQNKWRVRGQNIHSDFWDILVFFVILNSTQFIPIKIGGAQVTLFLQQNYETWHKSKKNEGNFSNLISIKCIYCSVVDLTGMEWPFATMYISKKTTKKSLGVLLTESFKNSKPKTLW